MKAGKLIFALCLLATVGARAQQRYYSAEIARTVMELHWKDSFLIHPGKPVKWTYDQGVVLRGIEGLWRRTADPKYLDYIRKSMDYFVQADGTIRTYKPADFNIDNVMPGRALLLLDSLTGESKYRTAVETLRNQLRHHPRTRAGGFWHKKIYPWQMWLDGLYMAQPFYAAYARRLGEDTAFNDVARQFRLMYKVALDAKTGLLYHGYDESRAMGWADKATGRSPHVWARAMGWYGMALVDALENFPPAHPEWAHLQAILRDFAEVVARYQDKDSGLWWDIVDLPRKEKNYFEASAASMFVYTLAKGVRRGWLPEKTFGPVAERGYAGIVRHFIKTDDKGFTHLEGTVSVSGLGGNPYRDGSFDYYMSEKVVTDDPKGIGAFLQAANEMEMATHAATVAKDGTGDFTSIQAAINSLPKDAPVPRTIRIGKGVYDEKIYIEKNQLILQGDGAGRTVITQAIARDEWRCLHQDDWGVATVNVDGSDITFRDLTIENTYGYVHKEAKEIWCPTDTVTRKKTIPPAGHQMALRTMNGTRIRAVNCHFKAFGGDTVSPWNVEGGLFYFNNCRMEGSVDLYCPRGWAWAENCHFVAHGGTAIVWHDGSVHQDSKTVLRDCSFQGYDGFRLGRYHRDAQFYLLDCHFAENMRNQPVSLVPTSNVIRWGHRVYFHNCHREGGDYAWHADNLHTAPGAPGAASFTPARVFGGRWYPDQFE